MQYLGSRVPLNIPLSRDFAATVKFYTNDVLGIFSCHNNNSDLCHFLGQPKWHITGLGSQTNIPGPPVFSCKLRYIIGFLLVDTGRRRYSDVMYMVQSHTAITDYFTKKQSLLTKP